MFGGGNGLAFVPLTTTSLDGVAPADAGAASGLVNVMQQVGGSLGLAVLVTVFGTASTDARPSIRRPGQTAAEFSRHVFTVAADKAFWTASAFLIATLLLVIFAIRPAAKPAAAAQPDASVDAPAEADSLVLADAR